MKPRVLLLALCSVSFVVAQACGGDDTTNDDASTDGTTDDVVTPPPDSGNDVVTPPGDGGGDGSAGDGGTTTDGSSGLTYQCGFGVDAGMVTDCSQCTGFTLPCVFCDKADASVLVGRCGSAQNGGCFANAQASYGYCPCPSDASACPEGFQVCRAGQGNTHNCRTCGEFQTDGLTCENGGTCTAADGGCN